jgi:hypothetical protein
MGETTINLSYETLENTSEHIKVRERMNQCINDFVLKREQLLTKMFYQNLSTEELLSVLILCEQVFKERGLDNFQVSCLKSKLLDETRKQELHCKLDL